MINQVVMGFGWATLGLCGFLCLFLIHDFIMRVYQAADDARSADCRLRRLEQMVDGEE